MKLSFEMNYNNNSNKNNNKNIFMQDMQLKALHNRGYTHQMPHIKRT